MNAPSSSAPCLPCQPCQPTSVPRQSVPSSRARYLQQLAACKLSISKSPTSKLSTTGHLVVNSLPAQEAIQLRPRAAFTGQAAPWRVAMLRYGNSPSRNRQNPRNPTFARLQRPPVLQSKVCPRLAKQRRQNARWAGRGPKQTHAWQRAGPVTTLLDQNGPEGPATFGLCFSVETRRLCSFCRRSGFRFFCDILTPFLLATLGFRSLWRH
eukprot:354008-Chlamydomonas_euryale.AAC.2